MRYVRVLGLNNGVGGRRGVINLARHIWRFCAGEREEKKVDEEGKADFFVLN